MKKRIASILLAVMMIVTLLPLGLMDTAWAAETANSGTCGDNVTWRLPDDGVLTISGTGDMADFEWDGTPWYSVRSQIKSVVIKDGVTSIGDCAFSGCSNLTKANIASGVKAIGNLAFSGCSSLTTVTVPASVTSIGESAFSRCAALTGVTIPSGVTNIGEYAFDSCAVLTSVDIPDGVTGIARGTFRNCTSLKNVTIPDSVTRIDRNAFERCTSLAAVTISRSVISIAEGTFTGSGTAVNVAAENKYYSSEAGTLYDKEKTTLLHAGNLEEDTFTIPDGVRRIAAYAFSDCAALKRITIPASVTSIGRHAFEECTSLTGVTIPDSVTDIGSYAFSGCNSLTDIAIPKDVTHIGQYAFGGCWGLTDMTLPSSMTEIEEGVFSGCKNLASITIPKSVTNIVGYAFYACDNLADVYYTGTAADWEKVTIENDGNECLTGAASHHFTNVPIAPTVRIGNSATSGKPMLTWNAVEGATSYRIYRSTSRGSGYSLLGTVTATSYTNTGAKAGTTYYYRVKACNDAGLSPYSNIVSGKVKSVTPKPSAPVVKIGNSASSGKPMLTWNAVSGATSYKVYRATSQNGTYSLLGTVTATSYTNTGAKAGVTYYYKVKAVNSAGESAYSNVVSGKVKSVTPKPSAPVVKIGHSATSGKPMLTWNAVDGAASYRVYRTTTKNGAYTVINTTKALTYTNTGAALGTTYYYKVEALNAAGKSMGFSAVVEGKVAPVLAVGYSSVSGKPQLTWKAVPGATEYQVYRSTQQNSGYSKINTTTATSYVNTGAKAGTTYYYRIVAVKGTAVSDFSNIVSARPSK